MQIATFDSNCASEEFELVLGRTEDYYNPSTFNKEQIAMQQQRTTIFNNKIVKNGRYILYWMQAAQRAEYNHALEFAIAKANERKKPLLVVFALTDDYPEANLRHYQFMLEGLRETQNALAVKGIKMVVACGEPINVVARFSIDAELVVADGGQLKIQRKWRQAVAKKIDCAFFEIETNLIIPVTVTSNKQEFAARTIRPKIHRELDNYLTDIRHKKPKINSLGLKVENFDISEISKALSKLKIDKSVTASVCFTGGTSTAKKQLRKFIREKLDDYDELRNDPSLDYQSNMSPYLHFGQISPLYIALEISKSNSKGKDAYLEELIVRRELSHNFVYYNNKYDSFEGLEPWSKKTLNFHSRDKREYLYNTKQLELAKTHDPYWNAAQKEMLATGKMHGYMRMYWGKKILEWSKTPQHAFKTALYLNNKYELDGRDANGFTGVSWCFGKHDRAWSERKVFGKIRYMNDKGLERKFDMAGYVRKVEALCELSEKGVSE